MAKELQATSYGWTSADQLRSHQYLWPAIERLLPEGVNKIIDIGCGNGFLASCLARKGYEVTGIDVSSEGIALAKNAYPHIFFCVASAYDNLSEKLGNDYDLVVSIEVIEHLYNPKLLLQNAHALLKAGGSLIVTTPYHGYVKNLALSLTNKWDEHHTVQWEGGHIKFFSEKTLRKLLIDALFVNISFHNVGRFRWLWKSIVCKAEKPI